MPKWIDSKTLAVLATVIGTAFVANYRLGVIERGQEKFTLEIASVEADLQSLRLRIVVMENKVKMHSEKLAERKSIMATVEHVLKDHGEALIRQGLSLERQSETLEKILLKLE